MIDQIAPFASQGAGSPSAVSTATRAPHLASPAHSQAADFSTVLGKLMTDSADILRTAEFNAVRGIMGEASVQEVVESVLAAEQTLQAAIAIRDKVTAAYLELSRMAI